MASKLTPGRCPDCERSGVLSVPRSEWVEAGGSGWLHCVRCDRCGQVERRRVAPLLLAGAGRRGANGYVD